MWDTVGRLKGIDNGIIKRDKMYLSKWIVGSISLVALFIVALTTLNQKKTSDQNEGASDQQPVQPSVLKKSESAAPSDSHPANLESLPKAEPTTKSNLIRIIDSSNREESEQSHDAVTKELTHFDPESIVRSQPVVVNLNAIIPRDSDGNLLPANLVHLAPFPDVPLIATKTAFKSFEGSMYLWKGDLTGGIAGKITIKIAPETGIHDLRAIINIRSDIGEFAIFSTSLPPYYAAVENNRFYVRRID